MSWRNGQDRISGDSASKCPYYQDCAAGSSSLFRQLPTSHVASTCHGCLGSFFALLIRERCWQVASVLPAFTLQVCVEVEQGSGVLVQFELGFAGWLEVG